MGSTLSNQPPKGMADWLPEEYGKRKYIFDAWRRVCVHYGYEEYLTPIVESADIYRAKSGEDVGGKELVTFKDPGGRELSIRPEMTPSVTRMVSGVYGQSSKPLRLFSIANFMRNERPQRGRNREFWQLNCDIFGSDSINADIEIMQLSLDIMLEFKPPRGAFIMYINNRKLIDTFLEKVVGLNTKDNLAIMRTMDKYAKLDINKFTSELRKTGLKKGEIETISDFMALESIDDVIKEFPALKGEASLEEIKIVLDALSEFGYKNWIAFKPGLIRGFDYYDGLVFEVFDNSAKNTRSLFGGGRYNDLAELFGAKSFPAVGVAPGDETLYLFLETWNLFKDINEAEEVWFVPIIDKSLEPETIKLANKLRRDGNNVEQGLETQKIGKALEYANKKNFSKVVIFGGDEKKKKVYKVKDMQSGKEKTIKL